jgi:flavin reductase (DIM6/NTAB) family NADH-FMN oxidoreductase RutF
MKAIFSRLLFGNLAPKPFFAVNIPNGEIKERVFLTKGTSRIDISNHHNVVCQSPFSIAIWLNADQLEGFMAGNFSMVIMRKEETLASVNLVQTTFFQQEEGSFFVFRIVDIKCFKPGLLPRYLMLKYFFSNERLPFYEAKAYGAVYSYPRKVIITSFCDNEYYNMFPMDFQGNYPESNLHLLGLKTSNITLNRIIDAGRVVVSSTDEIDSKTVYDLGAHHSKEPPPVDSLPFRTRKSEIFEFPVPEFSSSYRELEIVHHQILGSHCLLMGRIANSKHFMEGRSALYHVHMFAYPGSGYQDI